MRQVKIAKGIIALGLLAAAWSTAQAQDMAATAIAAGAVGSAMTAMPDAAATAQQAAQNINQPPGAPVGQPAIQQQPQQQPQPVPTQPVVAGAEATVPAQPAAPVDESVFSGSLFFSPLELATIQKALAGNVTGTAALGATTSHVDIPKVRVIALAGVVYRGPEEWTIWLNGRKVTPQNLLPEIMEIQVERDRVHLKWFDIGINNVISLTLRAHQTYDIVTGVLLPG